MLTCKLCNTRLEKKNLRHDGSMLCPVCGQIYWKAAVEKALRDAAPSPTSGSVRTMALRRRRPALRSA